MSRKIDTKKLVAKIFQDTAQGGLRETQTVTKTLASRKPKSSKSFFSFRMPGSFKQEFGGIDIGSSSVKFVLLGHDRGRLSIKDVQIEKLSKLSSLDRREDREKELQNALMKISSHVRSRTKVGIALNEPSLFAESVTIQRNAQKDLKELVQKELSEKHLIDTTTTFFDFVQTGGPDMLNNLQDLFVVAAPKELVYRQFGTAQSAGFRVLSVETNALATWYALRRVIRCEQTDKALFLDIGFRYTNLGILIGGRLVFNRIIPIAGERFTKAVERDLRCDFESAEQLKIQHGLKYSDRFRSSDAGTVSQEAVQVSKTLEQEIEALLNEVERSFQFAFKSESGSDTVRFQSIYLLGGSSRLAFLKEYLEKRWESPIRNVDLWQGLVFKQRSLDHDFLADVNDLMTVAVGVSLRVTEF